MDKLEEKNKIAEEANKSLVKENLDRSLRKEEKIQELK